jgi:hypothetical protein
VNSPYLVYESARIVTYFLKNVIIIAGSKKDAEKDSKKHKKWSGTIIASSLED